MSSPTIAQFNALLNRVTEIDGIGSVVPSSADIPVVMNDLNGMHTTINQLVLQIETQLNAVNNQLLTLQSNVNDLLGGFVVPVNTPASVHQFLTAYNSTTGAFIQAQPLFSDIAGQLVLSQIYASGTPSSTTYLRGDGSWSTVSGGSGSPGSPTGSLQGNNAGAFGGIPGTSCDFTNGTITIAPPSGGSPALFVTGAPGEVFVAEFLTNDGGAGFIIDPYGNIAIVSENTSDVGRPALAIIGGVGNIQEWYPSSGPKVVYVSPSGNLVITPDTDSVSGTITLACDSSGDDFIDFYPYATSNPLGGALYPTGGPDDGISFYTVSQAAASAVIEPGYLFVGSVNDGQLGFSSGITYLQGDDGGDDILDVYTNSAPIPASPVLSIDTNGNLYLVSAGIKDSTGSLGSSGQVLSSTGSEVLWVDASSGGGIGGTISSPFIPYTVSADTLADSAFSYVVDGGTSIPYITAPSTVSGDSIQAIWGFEPLFNIPGFNIADTTSGAYLGGALNPSANSILYYTSDGASNSTGLGLLGDIPTLLLTSSSVNFSLDIAGTNLELGSSNFVVDQNGNVTVSGNLSLPNNINVNGSNNLNSGSSNWQVVTNSGYIFNLPDATTLVNSRTFYIVNASGGGIAAYDAGGNPLTSISAGQVYTFVLADNSTTQGSWVYFNAGSSAAVS